MYVCMLVHACVIICGTQDPMSEEACRKEPWSRCPAPMATEQSATNQGLKTANLCSPGSEKKCETKVRAGLAPGGSMEKLAQASPRLVAVSP